jgi:hypothetical protein
MSHNNKTHSFASYSIPLLESDESVILHLGPFKILDGGEHRLLLGMNSEGSSSRENEMMLGYQPDLFVVYPQNTIVAILIAVPLIVTGASIAGYSWHKRKHGRHV